MQTYLTLFSNLQTKRVRGRVRGRVVESDSENYSRPQPSPALFLFANLIMVLDEPDNFSISDSTHSKLSDPDSTSFKNTTSTPDSDPANLVVRHTF